MDLLDFIKQLESEIAQDEKNLADYIEELVRDRRAAIDEKRNHLRFVEKRLQMVSPKPTPEATTAQLKAERTPQVTSKTFTDLVADATARLVGQEIVVSNVYDELVQMGVEMPNNARDRIGTLLNRLAERGVLNKVAQGGGKIPNRYRLAAELH